MIEEAGVLAGQLHVPPWVAITMVQDRWSVKRADNVLARGGTWQDAIAQVGSYARFGYFVHLHEQGLIPDKEFYPLVPDYWSGADPDDTDPVFLEVWRNGWEWNDRHPLVDRPKTHLPKKKSLQVFRGQDQGSKVGIAWSLDSATAIKFANGAAYRMRSRKGEVLSSIVDRRDIMGYMVGRRENEIIVDPAVLKDLPDLP